MRGFRDVGWDRMDSILSSLDDEIHATSSISFFREVNLSGVEHARERFAAERKPTPSYTAFVIVAVARSLREHPYANRRLFRGLIRKRLVEFSGVHISVAVERETRAANPETLYDADLLSIEEVSDRLVALAKREHADRERWTEFERWVRRFPRLASVIVFSLLPRLFPSLWLKWRGGSTLVTSPAKYGVDMIGGFWHWPLTFSFGYVKPRPIVVDGQLEIHPSTVLGMVWDRRVMVGAPAARFFDRVVSLLENPTELLRR